jgi:hypothetical protein
MDKKIIHITLMSLPLCISSLLISSMSHASHHLLSFLISLPLWHQWTKRILIIILLNGIGNLWVLFASNQFPPFPTNPREFYPYPTHFSMTLDLQRWLRNMIIWEIHMTYRYKLETIEPLKIQWATKHEILVIVWNCIVWSTFMNLYIWNIWF